MKAILEKIKLFWGKFVVLSNKKNFVFGFPLAVLTTIALCTRSLLVILTLVVWIVTIVANTDEE
jgi:hypothetical protein